MRNGNHWGRRGGSNASGPHCTGLHGALHVARAERTRGAKNAAARAGKVRASIAAHVALLNRLSLSPGGCRAGCGDTFVSKSGAGFRPSFWVHTYRGSVRSAVQRLCSGWSAFDVAPRRTRTQRVLCYGCRLWLGVSVQWESVGPRGSSNALRAGCAAVHGALHFARPECMWGACGQKMPALVRARSERALRCTPHSSTPEPLAWRLQCKCRDSGNRRWATVNGQRREKQQNAV